MKRQAAKHFQDLIVWQKAHQLVLSVYQYSKSFPKMNFMALHHNLGEVRFQSLRILQKDSKKERSWIKHDF
jgi:hypothetical protein